MKVIKDHPYVVLLRDLLSFINLFPPVIISYIFRFFGIKNCLPFGNSCPIAVFTRKIVKFRLRDLNVYRSNIELTAKHFFYTDENMILGDNKRVVLGKNLQEFIRRFDAGDFSHLRAPYEGL